MNVKNALQIVLGVTSLLWFGMAYAETVWIDVRSAEEHERDSIEGDVRISHWEIVAEVSDRFPEKDTEIRLYCVTGGRAGKALSALERAGYSNVTNVGGIEDAREERDLGYSEPEQ